VFYTRFTAQMHMPTEPGWPRTAVQGKQPQASPDTICTDGSRGPVMTGMH